MVFPREREAAYVQRMFGWQRARLRRLVLLAPPLLLFFVGVEALLLPLPISPRNWRNAQRSPSSSLSS